MNRFLSFVILTRILFADAFDLTKLGSIRMSHPAFSGFYKTSNATNSNDRYNLMITTFGVSLFSSTDTVQVVKDIGSHLNNLGSIKPEVITRSVTWPNEISEVPDGIFQTKMLAVPEGFLVPLKTKGGISLIDISAQPPQGPYTITTSGGGDWFYHRVEWQDMDGDGDLDIITCRAREPAIPILFGREDEQLVWLENPSGNYRKGWNTHVLAHGPDTFFRYTKLNTTEGLKACIIVPQFFTKSLSVYWTTQANGYFTDASKVQHRVIDSNIGKGFELEVVDLNNDGRLDLLVSTNGKNGTLLAYEIPDDFRTGTYTKHVIAVGFIPRKSGPGIGSAGNVLTARPNTAVTNNKPIILMSGDDDGRAYMFKAASEDPHDWSYTKTTIHDAGSGSTIGEVSAADVNGDGYTEVFVPSYTHNEIAAYTFAPQSGASGIIG